MLTFVTVFFVGICIEFCTTKCTNIPSGLYCTNLNLKDNEPLILQNVTESQGTDVQVIYVRNSSGKIGNETFSSFPKVKVLDIQFSNISSFSPEKSTIDTLYLMYNLKFPTLSAEFMEKCCQNVTVLFIVNNKGLEIADGAFKYMTNLSHLTISKQNITNITKHFFEGLEKLTYLNLKENGILSIDEDSFQNMTDLNHIILSHNNFTRLDLKTFQNLKVLEVVEMHGLNLSDFNISIFDNQKELKVLELPTTVMKKNLDLNELSKVLPKLETFGFLSEDKEDLDVIEFIKKCRASGYNVKFSSISDI